MAGETQQIILIFIFLFSSCTFGLFTLSTIGSKWLSCRRIYNTQNGGVAVSSRQYDLVFTLWEYCERTKSGDFVCGRIDDAPRFNDVLLDFQVIRILSVLCDVTSGILLLICLSLCLLRERKVCRRIVIVQCVFAILTVVLGLSNLIYASARAQDIVGEDVKFQFGWTCVTSWIATILAFLNTVMTLVLICVYLDRLTERMLEVRHDLGMDNVSVRTDSIRRISNALDVESPSTSVI